MTVLNPEWEPENIWDVLNAICYSSIKMSFKSLVVCTIILATILAALYAVKMRLGL